MCLQQFVIRVSGEDMWKLSICQALNDCHLGNKQTLSKVEWKEVVIKFAINTTRWLTTLLFIFGVNGYCYCCLKHQLISVQCLRTNHYVFT